MLLDYIEDINAFGEQLIRLHHFKAKEVADFSLAIRKTVLRDKLNLNLSTLKYIKPRNCNLILRISSDNIGVHSIDNIIFYCDLRTEMYEEMITLLLPFCKKETNGFQYLYDLDNPIDMLISFGGGW